MSQIKPIIFPLGAGTATQLVTEAQPYLLGIATQVSFKWYLRDDAENILAQGEYAMTPEQFAGWGTDDNYAINIVASSLPGVTVV